MLKVLIPSFLSKKRILIIFISLFFNSCGLVYEICDYCNLEYEKWYNSFLTRAIGTAYEGVVADRVDEIVEARVYIQGAQCDALPLYSESNVSIRNNGCSWNGGFQATLSMSYTLNGPYIIPDERLGDIWCEGNMQPVVGSEDNYSVDFVRMEFYYSCDSPDGVNNLEASNGDFCVTKP